ncbi:Histidine kinase domain-containing protein [uncultured Thiomicrorhabdus sp.]
MKISSQHRLLFASIILLLGVLTAIEMALKAPMLDIHISYESNSQQYLISPTSPSTQNLFSNNSKIESLGGIKIRHERLVEEPDQLNSWTDYNQFMVDMEQLYQASMKGQISAVINGESIELPVRERRLVDLPWLFWLQAVIASLAFLIAAGVYAFKVNNVGAQQFFFAGFALGVSALSAAVYSSREFLLDGNLILILSISNQFGAVFFTVALVALLGHYPQKLFKRFNLTPWVVLAGSLNWLFFSMQIYPDPSWVYSGTLILFAISFVLAFQQWQRTHNLPIERASLKWYLLSIYLGTGLFAAFILIPVSLGVDPTASQGMMFLVFLFMFVGIAFGIIRYRLFDLDRWWFNAWTWFLGGLLLILFDAFLISAIGMNSENALMLSLALIGWLYFPIRQLFMGKLFKKENKQNEQINHLIQKLFSAQNANELDQIWQENLQETWGALDLEEVKGKIKAIQMKGSGQVLKVPHLFNETHLLFSYPSKGSRLFNKQDVHLASLFSQIGQQALIGLSAREQAIEEKNRIFSDLHDDVGAKLLSMLYKTEDSSLQQITRAALQDLRDIVSQPNTTHACLVESLYHWKEEMQIRLSEKQILLHWSQSTMPSKKFSSLTLNHIMRILREATNNILKHAKATEVWINIEHSQDMLNIEILDNGKTTDPNDWNLGRGTRNMRHRCQLLGGQVKWKKTKGCQVNISIPLDLRSMT